MMQSISFGKKYFDSFENKQTLENYLKAGLSANQIASELGISHQTVREEIYKGMLDEVDFLKRRYDKYSARYSRKKDIQKVQLVLEQLLEELGDDNGN